MIVSFPIFLFMISILLPQRIVQKHLRPHISSRISNTACCSHIVLNLQNCLMFTLYWWTTYTPIPFCHIYIVNRLDIRIHQVTSKYAMHKKVSKSRLNDPFFFGYFWSFMSLGTDFDFLSVSFDFLYEITL